MLIATITLNTLTNYFVLVMVAILMYVVFSVARKYHTDNIPLSVRLRLPFQNRHFDRYQSDEYLFIKGRLNYFLQMSLKALGIAMIIGLFYGLADLPDSFRTPALQKMGRVLMIIAGSLIFFPFKAIRALHHIEKNNIEYYPPIKDSHYFDYVGKRITQEHIDKWKRERKMAIPAMFLGAGYVALLFYFTYEILDKDI